jgi:acyl carrier protein
MAEGRAVERTGAPVDEIAKLWGGLLHLKSVPHDVSFIELGGDSLLIIALLSRIEDEFSVYLDAEDILADLTVVGIAEAVEKARQAA